jgi:hypothetical protein
LLEEAAIDGIPVIAIDPKGDLGNLLLTFPSLRPEDFQPWVDPAEAARKGLTTETFAARTAEQWREGLAQWGEDGERIARFRDAVDLAIYTPGSSAGLPLTVLRSFDAPPRELVENDGEAYRERIASAVSGLLALLGVQADPISSREHILLSNLLDDAWKNGRNLDLAALIRGIQSPPFSRIGVIDLDTAFPAKDRFALAMSLNNLMASPGFSAWLEGEPLDVDALFHNRDGKPRLSILSIAHLSDRERMFFVTILLNEVLAWARSQAGTSSLRAILYMDEIFGYFPPSANPPAKIPMLTLLKQARAYGLGIVLATQNPVDLDYKGLSNTGTWFLGRLQTERDKARVLEGLEGASTAAGHAFDRAQMEALLASLGNRVFLMNNVHEDRPVLFQTRWVLSYLRGPLTRDQIRILMAPRKSQSSPSASQIPISPEAAQDQAATAAVSTAEASANPSPSGSASEDTSAAEAPGAPGVHRDFPEAIPHRPILPPDVPEFFLATTRNPELALGETLLYRPALLGKAQLHFVDRKNGVDVWRDVVALEILDENPGADPWSRATVAAQNPGSAAIELEREPSPGTEPNVGIGGATEGCVWFAALPAALNRSKTYADAARSLKNDLYRDQTLDLLCCPALKQVSTPGESERSFRLRLSQASREERDRRVEALRARYAGKFEAIQKRIAQARQRLEMEQAQATSSTLDAIVSVGSTFLKYLTSRKSLSTTNLGRASSTARAAGRAARQRGDVGQAAESLDQLNQQLINLDQEIRREVDRIDSTLRAEAFELVPLPIRPRKGDLTVDKVVLAWTPWIASESDDHRLEPAYSIALEP